MHGHMNVKRHDITYGAATLLCKSSQTFHAGSYAGLTAAYTQHIYVFNPSVTLQSCRHFDGFSN
jgi:hypothetical protein